MPRYYAAPGTPFKDQDAAVLGPWLQGLAESGHSAPNEILEEARSPESPAYPYFEWRDDVAADAYRRQQARKMANAILVKVKSPNGGYRPMRAFYSVVMATAQEDNGKKPPMKRRYVTVGQVRESPVLGEQVIADARDRLLAWASRYEQYREQFPSFEEEFGEVFEVIGGLVEV